jgi:protein-disulfide isomerase
MSIPVNARLALPVSSRDHIRGPKDAAVTLVEYGDYECPHCGRAYPIVREIERRMEDRLRFVYRHFPLTQMHPHAEPAAEAAEAAGSHGRFWEMHDTLFQHQEALDEAHLIQYGSRVGIDPQWLTDALLNHAFHERVREDFMSGVRSGVNGTPTFFINGIRYDGSYDLPALYQALEEAAEEAEASA